MLRFNRMTTPLFYPSRILTHFNGSLLRHQMFKRFQSIKTSTKAGSSMSTGKKATGIKALMKEYGFSALAVYLSISAIDLPLCYLLVHSMGKDEIEFYENKAKQTLGFGVSDEELAQKQELARNQENLENVSVGPIDRSEQGIFTYLWSQFSWTEFAIAYGVHKSLIFIRVPITAAITPGIVRALRRWGFKIGSDKLATTATIAKENIKDFTASSSKFGTRPNNKKWFWFF